MKTRVLFVALAIVSVGTLCAQNKVNGCVIDRTDNSKLIGVNVTLSNDSGQIALAPTANIAVMQNYHQVLMLNFNVNLDFCKFSPAEALRRIYNEDTESGILSGTKKYYIYQFCRIVRQCALFSCFFLDILT